ncbi:MAG: caspase family protein [Saprospiraceae bacterium]|nr:caspase family protein [Saprospiraceae bacterium]
MSSVILLPMKRSELKPNTGVALLFGVGTLGQHYGTHTDILQSPDNDAKDFEIIAKLNGLEAKTFLLANATRQNFQTSIAKAARSMSAGDFFLLVFSGFGGCVPNFPGKSPDRHTNTWCLYDSQVLTTEIKFALSSFQADVNILVISDCSSSRENNQKRPNKRP